MGQKDKQPARETVATKVVEEVAIAASLEPQPANPSSELSALILTMQQLMAQNAELVKQNQVINKRLTHTH